MSHRVHGLSGDDAMPDWPPLTTTEIEDVAAAFALDAPSGRPWRSPRPLSAAALVDVGARQVFVKRHHCSVRDADTLAEEHRYMAHLRAHGLPVPDVLRDRDGATAHVRGEWTYEVHARARGTDVYRDTVSWTPLRDLAHARAAGAMLARLHQAARDYDAPQRATHILVARDDLLRAADPVAALESQLPARPGLADYLSGRDWHDEFARFIVPRHARVHTRLAALPRLWTHNDWHVSNLCWDANGDIADVLDFGLASPASAMFDLATAIERNAIAWLDLESGTDAVYPDTARALIEGYRDMYPMNVADLELLADLLPLVHLDFALSETEYFHAITGSASSADLAYNGFLLGHTAWFDSMPAQDLAEAIRGLA